jgi:hypothetical protein
MVITPQSMIKIISWKFDSYSGGQENPCSYGTRSAINMFTKACHLILSWASWTEAKIHVNIIIPSPLRSVK